MFFVDPRAAIGEMSRVLRPEGKVAIATWAALERTPGYAAMVELIRGLFGPTHAEALIAPYSMGSPHELEALFDVDFGSVTVEERIGLARFSSLKDWIHTDVRGWTLSDMIDDQQYQQLLRHASTELSEFVMDDGRVEFAAPALIAVARR